MRIYAILRVTTLAAVLTALCLPVPAQAQDKPADNMKIVREKIRADKKLFIAENMQLTEPEAKAFWPVYEAYQKELGKQAERTLTVIDDYAAYYQSMSEAAAKELVDVYVAIQGDRVKLMESYLPKFRKVLPERKVLRYYQLENKINAVVIYGLAARIPLVK
jgi:hypothetical protein